MSTSTPTHKLRQPVIRCLPQDAAALTRLAHTRVRRERPGSTQHRYLDNLIRKPWGREYRVYDDALIDVWMLELRAGSCTSMHCHPRKDTFLLCVSGHGETVTGSARRIALSPGTVLHIEQGATHRSQALTAMTLIEIETPRDKFDLVRLEDDHGRRRTDYEDAEHTARLDPPLERVPVGPPRARVRPRSAGGAHRFALEAGFEVQQDPDGIAFAISLDLLGVLRRDIAIGTADDLDAVRAEHTYLTVRSAHPEDAS
jgi:mannose-6-phosphate isomerase-like protein (cupin superfamily)